MVAFHFFRRYGMTTRALARIALGIFAGFGLLLAPSGAAHLTTEGGPAEPPVLLPEVSYKRLLNDLQVVVASTPSLGESMTIGLVTRYGSAYDPAGKGGLAYLVSQMFLKGTQDKSGKDIQDELARLGASIEVSCDWDGMRFILRGQSTRFERSLLLLYQVVGEVVFNDDDFARVKAEILERLNRPEDPRQRTRDKFET